jgi:acylphosphatase
LGYDKVETMAEGPRDKLINFSEAVKKGPRAARVDEASMEWELATGEFQNFGVKYSA